MLNNQPIAAFTNYYFRGDILFTGSCSRFFAGNAPLMLGPLQFSVAVDCNLSLVKHAETCHCPIPAL